MIEQHADQFDEEFPERAPGSQEEFAASTYILGHLQQAGYVPLLDSVPVGDLVESTNIVALPAGDDAPETVVVASYDSPPSRGAGREIGAFLEVARALNVSSQGHSVGFVALGAEHSERLGGSLGSRRLAQFLTDKEFDPAIVVFGDLSGGAVTAQGAAADSLSSERATGGESHHALARAGFEVTAISGDPGDVADALLEFLAG